MKVYTFNNNWDRQVFMWQQKYCPAGAELRIRWGEMSKNDSGFTGGQIEDAADAFRAHYDKCPKCNPFLDPRRLGGEPCPPGSGS